MHGPRLRPRVDRPFLPLLLLAMLLPLWVLAAPTSAPAPAQAGARQMLMMEDADLFGRDIQVLKEVDLETCKSSCLANTACRALTYNTKARWCFLKDQFRDQRTFPGAISGRVVEGPSATAAQRRAADLGFLPADALDGAKKLAAGLSPLATPEGSAALKGQGVAEVAAAARAARGVGNGEPAVALFAAAVRLAPDDAGLWLGLAEALGAAKPDGWQLRNQRKDQASAAAINAYLLAGSEGQRFQSLVTLGQTLTVRQQWRPAMGALGAALALRPDPAVRSALDKLKADHGFRVTEHRVEAESPTPRICIEFSEGLARLKPNLADFVKATDANGTGAGLAVEVEDRQICVDGVSHGGRYTVQVRKGLPAVTGETLEKTVDLDIKVGNRTPAAHFLGRNYVLPKGGEATIPVVSVNADRLTAKVYRIGDRSMAQTLGDGPFLKSLSGYEAEQIADQTGELVWKGTVEVEAQLNRDVTTAVPVGALVPDLKPGVYALTAKPARLLTPGQGDDCEGDCGGSGATQWFVVSDLGLTALSGNDGLHTLVRSLSSAEPLAGVKLRLIARNNDILGTADTDAAGYARFEPGLLRGTGGNAPLLVTGEGKDGDYGFLDLSRTPFDLTDRGVDGRPSPKPLDLFMVAERGVYRPGETVHLTALVRDPQARAALGVPLTLVIRRPDGVERERLLVKDQGLGGHQVDVPLTRGAQRGTWRVLAYADPKGEPIGQTTFLVEDFEPERLDFALTAPGAGLDPNAPTALPIAARFLYGAPAAGLQVEGEVEVKVADGLAAWPGYRFGLVDDKPDATQRPLDPVTTDAQGVAEVPIILPELTPTSRPLVADLAVRVLDAGGRPVERNLTLPVLDGQARLGVRPLFEGEAPEGGTAGFEVIALGQDGTRRAASKVAWTLDQVETNFQWYRTDDGTYDYEPVERTKRVASGTLDLNATSPGKIETPVKWGAYRLRLAADGLLPASTGFEAGWYVSPKAADTPDQLKISLDKPTYRVGNRARVHIEPHAAQGGAVAESGLALVMVVDDRLIAMQAVEVPATGTTLDLPVTADWGPGAYVTAVLYRPMDLSARRMPGRSIGLAWAGVDPQDRRLAVDLAVEPGIRPRGPMPVKLSVTNLKPGTEAYVTLAAVDQGILNVTGYKAPEPDTWYFGQRRLGLEFRDLYGQLIDRMQGAPGVVRSGGDGGLAKMLAPPPSEELMAWFSGVVRLDDQGQAVLEVPIPDFNGTVKLMAMAWTAAGVGHGVTDALVRDPVVVSASLPRFLAPGDRSRLLLGLTQVEGEGGEVQIAVTTEHGLVTVDPAAANQRLTLAPGVRADVSIPLEAQGVGDEALVVAVTTPAGQVLTKHLTLGVRSNAPATFTSTRHELLPNAAPLTLTPDLLNGLVPGTGTVLASVSRAGRLDIAGILRSLDRYPHGCTEQLVSRALPLLYLDQVALAAGLSGDPAVPPRIREAITRVLANASADGRFGLWSPGGDDLWLDAFATDFLTRAKERGYEVPQSALDAALDNLKNVGAYTNPSPADAYALYVLARNGRASIGDLRYLADERLNDLGSPMAKAQIGAALALYGDRIRADAVLAAAAGDLELSGPLGGAGGWRADYGSSLRDAAAVLALAAESGTESVDLRALTGRVQDGFVRARYRSTQEDTWLLLAAQALNKGKGGLRLEVDGKIIDGAWFGRFDEAQLAAAPVVIRNLGSKPVDGMVGVLGVPRVAPPAGGNGYVIERAYYDLDGRRVELTAVPQGSRVLAVITVRADAKGAARLIVDDPLPAGLEIDNPNLMRSANVARVPGLDLLAAPAHQEFRSDRFVAAVDRSADDPLEFQLGYLLRAVTPGTYAQPPAAVEDMYDPSRRAWTDAGTATVLEADR
ncbi:alpha-2-macroglobulin family protein [uncultured Thiodictyon sp.]|uniref:alpha-2-macroglobulin family protein n=1 Tax=uncultured Thiodictyon sp. TaxID=1846217 RepID=UPI0025E8DA16|nr:alpha-2-macroglobulin family protein [uncultured Thiodictyon sp.]